MVGRKRSPSRIFGNVVVVSTIVVVRVVWEPFTIVVVVVVVVVFFLRAAGILERVECAESAKEGGGYRMTSTVFGSLVY